MKKIIITLAIITITSVPGFARTLNCEGLPSYSRFYTSASSSNDEFIKVELDTKTKEAKLTLVKDYAIEIFEGNCVGNIENDAKCEFSSTWGRFSLTIDKRTAGSLLVRRARIIQTATVTSLVCLN